MDNDQPIKGILGYSIDGEYAVSVPDNPAKYYVRFAGGGFAQVDHRGRVAPIPDLPVEVGVDRVGNMVILGGDPARGSLFPGVYEVGPHSHARGSGMEFAVDPRLLTPVKAAPLTGLTVGVAQGAYWIGGSLRWWGGGAIPLTPPAGSQTWAWVVVGIDAAGSLVASTGAAISITAPRDPSAIPALVPAGSIPLAAVALEHGQTELDEDDFVDLRFPVGGRGAAYVLIRDEQPSGTDGGTFTAGSWQTRALNTVAAGAAGIVSLSSSQITLAAGTYRLWASAPALGVGGHQARWQNITAGATAITGTTELAGTSQTRSVVAGRFTITASAVFELQHACAVTHSSSGLGAAASLGTEVYAEVALWRE